MFRLLHHAPVVLGPRSFRPAMLYCVFSCAELLAADSVEKTLKIVITRRAQPNTPACPRCPSCPRSRALQAQRCTCASPVPCQPAAPRNRMMARSAVSTCQSPSPASLTTLRPAPPRPQPTPPPLVLPSCSKLVKQRAFLEALEERLEPPLKQVRQGRQAPPHGTPPPVPVPALRLQLEANCWVVAAVAARPSTHRLLPRRDRCPLLPALPAHPGRRAGGAGGLQAPV